MDFGGSQRNEGFGGKRDWNYWTPCNVMQVALGETNMFAD